MKKAVFCLFVVAALMFSILGGCAVSSGAGNASNDSVPDGFTESQYQTMELYEGEVVFQPVLNVFSAGGDIVCKIVNNMDSELRLKAGEMHIETEINGKWYEIPSQFKGEAVGDDSYTRVFEGYVFPCVLSADLGEYINRAGHYRVIRPVFGEESVICCEFYISESESETALAELLPESPFVLADEDYLDFNVSEKCSLDALGNPAFEFEVTNSSDAEITIGEYYYIEVLIDGKWLLTPADGADDVAWYLAPDGSQSFTAHLISTRGDRIFDWPENARYRIIKPVTTADDARVFCASSEFGCVKPASSTEEALRNIYGENLLCEDGEFFFSCNRKYNAEGLKTSLTGLDDTYIDNGLPYSLSVDGVSVLSRDDDLDGMMQLEITFTNDSDSTLSTESEFRIEQELDGEWYYCAAAFDDSVEDYFEPHESASRSCSLANRVYTLEGQRTEEWVNFAPGHYRVLKKVGLASSGSGKFAYVSAELTIRPDGSVI